MSLSLAEIGAHFAPACPDLLARSFRWMIVSSARPPRSLNLRIRPLLPSVPHAFRSKEAPAVSSVRWIVYARLEIVGEFLIIQKPVRFERIRSKSNFPNIGRAGRIRVISDLPILFEPDA